MIVDIQLINERLNLIAYKRHQLFQYLKLKKKIYIYIRINITFLNYALFRTTHLQVSVINVLDIHFIGLFKI